MLGGRVDAVAAAEALNVEAVLFDPLSRQIVPNAATLYVPVGSEELIVQFLHTPLGARREEIRSTAQILAWSGLRLPVMHPILCVESKLDCLYTLDQRGRQDLRHLKLALIAVEELLNDLCHAGDERAVLGIFERLAATAAEEFGLRLFDLEGMDLAAAIYAPDLKKRTAGLPKLAAFFDKRWPQLEKRLLQRRARHGELRE